MDVRESECRRGSNYLLAVSGQCNLHWTDWIPVLMGDQ